MKLAIQIVWLIWLSVWLKLQKQNILEALFAMQMGLFFGRVSLGGALMPRLMRIALLPRESFAWFYGLTRKIRARAGE